MKAIHKYRGSKKPEHIRRIAQSLGYRPTVWQNPLLMALLERGGLRFSEQTAPAKPELIADTETITL